MPTDSTSSNELSIGQFISKFPSVEWVSSKQHDDGFWWVKFHLNMENPVSIVIVQALAHILNAKSLNDPLPTRFFPTSSPPYMNGGPKVHLHWVIEPFTHDVTVSDIFAAIDSTLLFDIESEVEWLSYPATDDEEDT